MCLFVCVDVVGVDLVVVCLALFIYCLFFSLSLLLLACFDSSLAARCFIWFHFVSIGNTSVSLNVCLMFGIMVVLRDFVAKNEI